MALNPLTDFHNFWRIDGAGSPVADVYGSTRALILSSGATPPRAASYKRRRGAEFRTSTFDATSPAAFANATGTGLNSLLYVASKITDFTWFGWMRPQRTGLTSVNLTPISGIVSPTNYGSPPRLGRSTCLSAIPQASGNGTLYVFVGGNVLDTTQMTQTEGPVSTAPIVDDGWNAVAVSVDGNAAVNNGISSVTVRTLSPTGVRRTYTNAARKAGAKLLYDGQPSDGHSVTIGSRAYTFKTTLSGSAATAPITNGTGTNIADGDSVTIGDRTYTWRDTISTNGTQASAIIEFNTAVAFENLHGQSGADTTHGEIKVRIGGFDIYILLHAATVQGLPAGYFEGFWTAKITSEAFSDLLSLAPSLGPPTNVQFVKPAVPNRTSPDYTGENGLDFTARKWATVSPHVLVGASYEVTVKQTLVGASTIPVQVIDGWLSGASGSAASGPPATWRCRVKSGTVDNPAGPYSSYNPTAGQTQGILKGGADASPAYTVKRGANWTDSRANLIAAINKTGNEGVEYANVATANPICTAAANGANDITLTSKKIGTAGNGDICSEASTVLTAANFSGGAAGTAGEVKIGATDDETAANLVSAINDSGTEGIAYGTGTTQHPDVEASISSDMVVSGTTYGTVLLRARVAGAAGNSILLAKTGNFPDFFYDEFGDEAVSSLWFGNDAGAFVVPTGYRPDQSDLRGYVGGMVDAPAVSAGTFKGTVGDHALLNRTITSLEFAELTTTPPPTSTRDRGWFRGSARLRYSAKTDSMSTWRGLVRLATGAKGARGPVTLNGRRCAVRLWNVEAGCPAAISSLQLAYEKHGGRLGGAPGVYGFPGFERGVDRSTAKENLEPGFLYDLLNETFAHRRARRRRGFKIEAAAGSINSLPGAVYDCTTSTGEVRHLAFFDGTVYLLDNGVLTSLDTGWPSNELPTVATVGIKTFICTSQRQRVLIEGTFYTPGIAAPTSAPGIISIEQSTEDGVVVTPPGWEYVVTYYDGSHLTESGPSPSSVALRDEGAFPSDVTIGLPVSPSSSVTARKVYKRKVGTDTYFLVATVANNTATTYEDTSDEPTDEVLEALGDLAVTAEFPPITACAEHEGRLVGWGDPADERTVYYSVLGDGERWFPLDNLLANASVRASVSYDGRHWVLTDATVEVVDGDFVRGDGGAMALTHKVIDPSRGVFGPFAACIAAGRLFWADVSGVHTLGRGADQKDVTTTVSWPVLPFVQNAIDTAGTSVSMAFNHVSQELWVTLTQANPSSDTKNRIVLVLALDPRLGPPQWAPYDHALSWVSRMRDGLYGSKFMGVDYFGQVLELDVYEGDGIQGNESWFSADGNAITAIDTSTNTLTFSGTSFPTTGLRGVSAVLEDISDPSTPFHRRTILSTTATTIVLDSLPSGLVVGDKVHVGGIIGKIETPEVDLGNGEQKKFLEAVFGISDLTAADL